MTKRMEQAMHDQNNDPEVNHAGLRMAEDTWTTSTTRKSFLKGAAFAGAGATSLGVFAPAAALAKGKKGG